MFSFNKNTLDGKNLYILFNPLTYLRRSLELPKNGLRSYLWISATVIAKTLKTYMGSILERYENTAERGIMQLLIYIDKVESS